MSALNTPSSWLFQTLDSTELSGEDLLILVKGIFTSGNTTFEKREDNAIVLKLSYSIKLDSLLDKFGDYKENIRIIPLSIHHTQEESSRFLELISRKRVYPVSPEKDHPGSPTKRFRIYK